MRDSQRFASENLPQIAKIIVIHRNLRRYCRKANLYPICITIPKYPPHTSGTWQNVDNIYWQNFLLTLFY